MDRSDGGADLHGCHADVERGRFFVPCWSCFGKGCNDCVEGYRYFSRCQNFVRNEASNVCGSIFRAYRWMSEKAILPVGNSYLEQSAFFVNCCGFIEHYSYSARKLEDERAQRLKAAKAHGKRQSN